VRRINRYLPFLLVFLAIPLTVHAQGNTFDISMGFGTNRAKANSLGTDTGTGASCTPGGTDTTCAKDPSLGGFSMGFAGDYMFRPHFGLGFEGIFQPTQQTYNPFTFRQTFYDFNGIYAPINTKRVALKIEGGAGGARTSVYVPISSGGIAGNASELYNEDNHFAVHAGVGVQIYVTEHIFIRPQFDYRYVPGFTNQFTDNVTGGSVWIGYSFGDR
jgi:opacity protein-like surface antigen